MRFLVIPHRQFHTYLQVSSSANYRIFWLFLHSNVPRRTLTVSFYAENRLRDLRIQSSRQTILLEWPFWNELRPKSSLEARTLLVSAKSCLLLFFSAEIMEIFRFTSRSSWPLSHVFPSSALWPGPGVAHGGVDYTLIFHCHVCMFFFNDSARSPAVKIQPLMRRHGSPNRWSNNYFPIICSFKGTWTTRSN